MTKYDLVWANLSNPARLALIVSALEGDERQKYCDATADFNGWTALHYAAASGNKMMMRMLLRAGANPKIKSTKQFWYGIDYKVPPGSTPADVARICEEEEAFKEVKDTPKEKTDAERAAEAAAAAAPVDVETLTVVQLKDELRERDLPQTGKRAALVARLQDAVDKEATTAEEKKDTGGSSSGGDRRNAGNKAVGLTEEKKVANDGGDNGRKRKAADAGQGQIPKKQ